MRATMLLLVTSNGVGVNVRLVGYGLSISRYQGIYTPCHGIDDDNDRRQFQQAHRSNERARQLAVHQDNDEDDAPH